MPETNRTAQRLSDQMTEAMRRGKLQRHPHEHVFTGEQWPSPNISGPFWTTQGTSQATYSAAGDILKVAQT